MPTYFIGGKSVLPAEINTPRVYGPKKQVISTLKSILSNILLNRDKLLKNQTSYKVKFLI